MFRKICVFIMFCCFLCFGSFVAKGAGTDTTVHINGTPVVIDTTTLMMDPEQGVFKKDDVWRGYKKALVVTSIITAIAGIIFMAAEKRIIQDGRKAAQMLSWGRGEIGEVIINGRKVNKLRAWRAVRYDLSSSDEYVVINKKAIDVNGNALPTESYYYNKMKQLIDDGRLGARGKVLLDIDENTAILISRELEENYKNILGVEGIPGIREKIPGFRDKIIASGNNNLEESKKLFNKFLVDNDVDAITLKIRTKKDLPALTDAEYDALTRLGIEVKQDGNIIGGWLDLDKSKAFTLKLAKNTGGKITRFNGPAKITTGVGVVAATTETVLGIIADVKSTKAACLENLAGVCGNRLAEDCDSSKGSNGIVYTATKCKDENSVIYGGCCRCTNGMKLNSSGDQCEKSGNGGSDNVTPVDPCAGKTGEELDCCKATDANWIDGKCECDDKNLIWIWNKDKKGCFSPEEAPAQ